METERPWSAEIFKADDGYVIRIYEQLSEPGLIYRPQFITCQDFKEAMFILRDHFAEYERHKDEDHYEEEAKMCASGNCDACKCEDE